METKQHFETTIESKRKSEGKNYLEISENENTMYQIWYAAKAVSKFIAIARESL